MADITTSLVVQFSATSGGILTAEIDSRPDGLNHGNTSFSPGDTAYYLLFATPNVKNNVDNPITQTASYGAPVSAGSGTMTVTETLTFAGTNKATTSKPISGGFSSKWLGNSLGQVTTANGYEVRAAQSGVGALEVTYTTSYDAYSLSSPTTLNGATSFPIVVLIRGYS